MAKKIAVFNQGDTSVVTIVMAAISQYQLTRFPFGLNPDVDSVTGFAFVKMVNLRHLLVKFKFHWNNFRQLVKSHLNLGSNRCLDLIMIVGGIQPVAGAEPWKRNCLTLYRLLGFYQFIMALTRIGFSIKNQDDLVGLCASILVALAVATGYLKAYILKHFDDVILQSKAFLQSNMGHSGDPEYDASVRREAARAAGKVTVVVFFFLCCAQVVVLIPTSARDRIMGIPEQFHAFGLIAARLLQELFVCMVYFFWGSRYFCCSLTVMPLLLGLKSELIIVARDYETIDERVQAQVLQDQNTVAGTSRKLKPNVLRWKYLKQILGTTVEQHVELLRNIHLVQPFVSIAYAITYYSTMVYVSIFVLLVIRGGLSMVSIVMVVSGFYFTLECYFWCHLIESIEEIMEKIADSAAQLGFGLEHSLENHSEYIQMRTSLMIIQLNASQSGWFSCGGIFPITVESFGDLCFIIYRLATFLLDID